MINPCKGQEYASLVAIHVKIVVVVMDAHIHNCFGIYVRYKVALHSAWQRLRCFWCQGILLVLVYLVHYFSNSIRGVLIKHYFIVFYRALFAFICADLYVVKSRLLCLFNPLTSCANCRVKL